MAKHGDAIRAIDSAIFEAMLAGERDRWSAVKRDLTEARAAMVALDAALSKAAGEGGVMGPTAIQALSATRHTNGFFVPSTPVERRKWAALRYAVNRVAQQSTPEDPMAIENLRTYATHEFERLGYAVSMAEEGR